MRKDETAHSEQPYNCTLSFETEKCYSSLDGQYQQLTGGIGYLEKEKFCVHKIMELHGSKCRFVYVIYFLIKSRIVKCIDYIPFSAVALHGLIALLGWIISAHSEEWYNIVARIENGVFPINEHLLL